AHPGWGGARHNYASAPRPGASRPRAAPPAHRRPAGLRLPRSSSQSRHYSSRRQECPHLLQANPHPTLHRAEWDVHPAGNLHVGVATKVREFERSPLGVGQLAKPFLDLLALEIEGDRLPGIGHLRAGLGLRQIDLAAESRASAKTINGPVANDREQPVAQAAPAGVKTRSEEHTSELQSR